MAQVRQMVLGVRVAIPRVCTRSLQHGWRGRVGYTRTGGRTWSGPRAPIKGQDIKEILLHGLQWRSIARGRGQPAGRKILTRILCNTRSTEWVCYSTRNWPSFSCLPHIRTKTQQLIFLRVSLSSCWLHRKVKRNEGIGRDLWSNKWVKRIEDWSNSIFGLLFSTSCTCGLSTMYGAAQDIRFR